MYLYRHDSALKVLFYEMLHDLGLIDEVPPWQCPAKPRLAYESDNVQAYSDVPVFVHHEDVRCNRADARIVNHKTKRVTTLKMSCPWVNNREKKSKEKTVKYVPLRWELKQQFPGYEVKQPNIVIIGRWTSLQCTKLWGAEVKRC